MDTLRVIKDLLNGTSLSTCKSGKTDKIINGTALPSYFDASEICYRTNLSYESIIGCIDTLGKRGRIFKATLGDRELFLAMSEDVEDIAKAGLIKTFNLDRLEFNPFEEGEYSVNEGKFIIKEVPMLDTRQPLGEVIVRYILKSKTSDYTEEDDKCFNQYWMILSSFITKDKREILHGIIARHYRNKNVTTSPYEVIMQELR